MTAHQDALFEEPLYECTAYKSTKISDIVCQRNVRLYSNRVLTLHPTNRSEKVWYLSSGCTLSPEYQEEIHPGSFSVRPPGSWSVTTKAAALAGGGSPPIELYCVTIHWPASWLATRGYTSFTLGFEEAREAAQWHSRVQRQISNLRMRSASSKGDASVGHSSKPSYDDRSLQWSSGGTTVTRKVSQDKGFVASALEHWLGSRGDKSAQDESGVPAQPYRMPTSPVQIPIPSRPSSAPTSMEDADCGDEHAYGQRHCSDPGYASSDSGSPFPYPAAQEEQRWVPYRHTNGVAIYHQKQSKCSVWAGDEQGEGLGSEYMASSIVRGSPDECLAVLTDLSSNTTILGPASKIELLEDGDERQVLRITVEATGMARRLCAPREVIVERLFKREECGVDVILFSSCDPPPMSPRAKRRNGLNASTSSFASATVCRSSSCSNSNLAWGLPSCMLAGLAAAGVAAAGLAAKLPGLPAVNGTGSSCSFAAAVAMLVLMLLLAGLVLVWRSAQFSKNSKHGAAAGTAGKGWKSWLVNVAAGGAVMWYKPVQAFVQGGYTISPREDCNGAFSPECLVTCILKVELGGWLGERSWLRAFADALGWVDAYVERMLMAVILVKDEVEQRKFLVQPFSILTSTSHTALAMPPSPSTSMMETAGAMGEITLDGGMGQQQQERLLQRQRRSRRWQQGSAPGPTEEAYPLWQQQQQQSQLANEQLQYYRHQQQGLPQQQVHGEQQAGYTGPIGSSSDVGHQKGSLQKQKGRLGRMASRIYALRPRILRGSNSERAEAPVSTPDSTLFKDSISFNSHITARTADARSSPAPGDNEITGSFHASGPGAIGSAGAVLDLCDPQVLLASAGLPPDTVVVQPEYYLGGPQGPAARGATLNSRFWQELHTPGTPAPFKLRGHSYLEDRQKVDGGMPQFVLGSVDLVETPGPTQHISRFLPQVRLNQAAYSFVVNLIIPGTPMLSLVAVFINEHHPDILDPPATSTGSSASSSKPPGTSRSQLGPSGDMDTDGGSLASGVSYSSRHASKPAGSITTDPDVAVGSSGSVINGDDADVESCSQAAAVYERPADTSDWQPFDYALHRFLHGDDATRTSMFKLIPHIAEGSWVIKQSVGTVPVILGNKLKTVYYQTDRYIEACCDVTSSSAAAYITGMVRGATKSLVIDLGFVLEGQHSEELPEALLGAFRLNHLDCTTAQKIDTSRELPLLPRPLQHHQLVALQQGAQQQLAVAGAAQLAAAAQAVNSGDASVSKSATLRGAGVAATVIAAGVLSAESPTQQTARASGAEQLQQLDAVQVQALALQLQQKIRRSSLSPLEGGRTMTGHHGRSRSAASADELISASFNPHPAASSCNKNHSRPKPSGSFSAASPRKQQQQSQDLQQQQQPGMTATPRDSCHSESILSGQLSNQPPPSIKTALSGIAAAAASTAGDATVSGEKGSGFVNVTPARQLFSSFLSFGGADKSSGGKVSSAAAAAAPTASNAEGSATGDAGAAGATGVNSGGPFAYGAVSMLSSTATPAGTGTNTPNAATAAAGALLTSVNSVGSVGARSGHGIATPTAAVPAAVGLRGHHRTSSNSDCKTPAAAAAAAAGACLGWPASPPTATGEWSSKLSAAAYISRAHAAALAASAQRRSGHRGSHQHSTSSPPTGSYSNDTVDPTGSAASPRAYLSGSPPHSTPAATVEAVELPAGKDSWQTKRPRTSSNGTAVIHEHRKHQQHSSSSSGADILVLGMGQKMTASEQLRLAKQQQQSGAGYRGTWGSGVHHHASSSSGSGLSVLANATNSRQSSATGLVAEASGSAANPAAVSFTNLPQSQGPRKVSHRRFASLQFSNSAQ